MEGKKVFYVVVNNVLPGNGEILPEADSWVERGHRAELARLQVEADRLESSKLEHDILQKQIMMETSFSGSEGKPDVFFHSGRTVIQRTLLEEMRFSNSDPDVSFQTIL